MILNGLGPAVPFMLDTFFFTERAEFVDRTASARVFFADQSEHEFRKCCGRNIDPELVIIIAPYFLGQLAHVLGI